MLRASILFAAVLFFSLALCWVTSPEQMAVWYVKELPEAGYFDISPTMDFLTPASPSVSSSKSSGISLSQLFLSWMKQKAPDADELLLETISDEVVKYDDPYLLLAIIYNESFPKFDPLSYSKIGAVGLMQINPDVWADELIRQGIIRNRYELWRIDKNIQAGNYIIKHYLSLYRGNLKKALTAYMGGDRSYAFRVIRTLKELRMWEIVVRTQAHNLARCR